MMIAARRKSTTTVVNIDASCEFCGGRLFSRFHNAVVWAVVMVSRHHFLCISFSWIDNVLSGRLK